MELHLLRLPPMIWFKSFDFLKNKLHYKQGWKTSNRLRKEISMYTQQRIYTYNI